MQSVEDFSQGLWNSYSLRERDVCGSEKQSAVAWDSKLPFDGIRKRLHRSHTASAINLPLASHALTPSLVLKAVIAFLFTEAGFLPAKKKLRVHIALLPAPVFLNGDLVDLRVLTSGRTSASSDARIVVQRRYWYFGKLGLISHKRNCVGLKVMQARAAADKSPASGHSVHVCFYSPAPSLPFSSFASNFN